MPIFILIAFVLAVVGLARFGIIPSERVPTASAFFTALGLFVSAAIVASLSYLDSMGKRLGGLRIVRNAALALMAILIFVTLLVGCTPRRPPVPDPYPELMHGEGTTDAPAGWRDYCARAENHSDPAC